VTLVAIPVDSPIANDVGISVYKDVAHRRLKSVRELEIIICSVMHFACDYHDNSYLLAPRSP